MKNMSHSYETVTSQNGNKKWLADSTKAAPLWFTLNHEKKDLVMSVH